MVILVKTDSCGGIQVAERKQSHCSVQQQRHHSKVTMADVLLRVLRGLRMTLIQTGIMKFFVTFLVKVHVVTSGETFGADTELLNQLRKNLKLKMEWQRNGITMLFCPITCRVGSDVEAAMTLVSGDQKVILVLMHHTRDMSYSTAGTEWSHVYPNVILSCHVLFHESVPGLLTCSTNKVAVGQMLNVLNHYSTDIWTKSVKILGLVSLSTLAYYLYRTVRYPQLKGEGETITVTPRI
ncbi:uncharacterized protein V3H82_015026 [Fundulus diaphanus]